MYTATGEWIPAGQLTAGDRMRRVNGSYGVIEAARLVVRPEVIYNLTVEGAHTFFVGEAGWLVHNCPFPGGSPGGRFPDTKELAKRMGVAKDEVHGVKEAILKDKAIKSLLEKLGAKNPDIGWDDAGNIVLKNVKTGKTINTGVPLDSFK